MPDRNFILKFKSRSIRVASFAEASAVYSAARDASGLGGSRWPDGRIFEQGKLVATVSYNGRVWAAKEWKSGDEPIFDNRIATAP